MVSGIMQKKNKEIIVQGQDYEIYKVNDYFMVHIYGGPFAAVNTLTNERNFI